MGHEHTRKVEVDTRLGPRVAILDAGAQYLKLIDARIRELNVSTCILPLDTPVSELEGYDAIVISGGPNSVNVPDAPHTDPDLFTNFTRPILGICYGMQEMAYILGGRVTTLGVREDGPSPIRLESDSSLFQGLSPEQHVLMSHGDSVTVAPPGFRPIASSGTIIAAMENVDRHLYAVQFHPETDLTQVGSDIFRRFLFDIAQVTPDSTPDNLLDLSINEIRRTVGHHHVLVLVSGGVDSTVLAALVGKALSPDQIHALHIDTGFMRHHESQAVVQALAAIDIPIQVIDASALFTAALTGITDPEEQRIIIGDLFMDIVDQQIDRLGLNPNNCYLAQGTLRPDLIESASLIASGKADKIKTHHNDSPKARLMRDTGRVIEPLRELHKYQVKQIGQMLGLPDELIYRQPFPGPGLAIRIRCTTDRVLPGKDSDIISQLQAFATTDLIPILLPVKSVGVQGDERSWKQAVALSGPADWKSLYQLALSIPRTVKGINRVLYLFGDQPQHPLDTLTPTLITSDTINQLRQADAIVNQILAQHNLLPVISQFPVVLLPLNFGIPGHRSIVLRPVITRDFMTAKPALPGKEIPETAVYQIVDQILARVPGISRVLYDLTPKPPGTTEWE